MPTYGDLLTNGSFTSGTAGWWAGNPAMVTLAADPAAGGIATASTDALNLYDAVFGQDGITLRAGAAYTLSFTARASRAGVTMRVAVGLGQEPWTPAEERIITLGTVDTNFVMPFTSTLTTPTGQLTFQIGQESSVTVTLTEVRLTTCTVREGFYTDPDSNAAKWLRANRTDPRAPMIERSLVNQPGAHWFGDWNPIASVEAEVRAYVTAATNAGQLPIIVAYAMYLRDNNGESSGGMKTAALYRSWINAFAAGVGDRPALIVVEPDSLAQAEYLPPANRPERYELVTHAAQALAACPLARVYLDGGNATWLQPTEMAARLQRAGIASVKGFAIAVANFDASDISCAYGQQVVQELTRLGIPGARFVVDTSRNGNGAMDDVGQHVGYCNPAGRRLGAPSSIGAGGAEYLLWIKVPGDSDGKCGVGPDIKAGDFSPYLAQRLIEGW
ncbi:glycoside hydrolase family 6 protein [Streptomyces sp. NPDC088745]|uniref:glycoside hydrolase family 6 protein n=1 Tax=Streptomyces sp. NPDC088745 TaxID=3365884 RepID=UPI00382F371A